MREKDEEMDRPACNSGKRTKKCGARKRYDNNIKDSVHTRIREKAPQVSPLKAKRGSTHRYNRCKQPKEERVRGGKEGEDGDAAPAKR